MSPTIPRGPIGAMFSSPGPARYGLPGLTGTRQHDPRSAHYKAPAYHIGLKLSPKGKDGGPPFYALNSKMQINGMEKPPAYSITPKRPLNDQERSPGPAVYMRDDSCTAPKAPSYTIRIKHREANMSSTPGPAHYGLPNPCVNMTCPPAYSIAGIHDLSRPAQTPGPGTYNIVPACLYMNCEPKYSIATRSYPPVGQSVGPGPAAYAPDKLQCTPKYTMGIRHSEYIGVMLKESHGKKASHSVNCSC